MVTAIEIIGWQEKLYGKLWAKKFFWERYSINLLIIVVLANLAVESRVIKMAIP